MKTTNDFVDFPIPLGAEWLHTKKGIFDEIVNDPAIQVNVQTTKYHKVRDIGWYDGEELPIGLMGFGKDQKFVDSSWLDFFKDYIVPSIQERILYDQIVKSMTIFRIKQPLPLQIEPMKPIK